jgi:hypothetical protein
MESKLMEDKEKRRVLIALGTGGIAAALTAVFANEMQKADALPERPQVDTRKGPEQLTRGIERRIALEGHKDRMDRAEEKRKRRGAKLIRDLKEN